MEILTDFVDRFFAVTFFFGNGEVFFRILFVPKLAKAVCIVSVKNSDIFSAGDMGFESMIAMAFSY